MVEALRHRGPDDDGVTLLGPVTLAHTGLAIIDVEGGDQPLGSEDGAVTAIVNGEIYNHSSCAPGSRSAATASRPTPTARWWCTPMRSTGSISFVS
jgi:hypothetical protein